MDFKINTDGMLWLVADPPQPRLDFETKARKLTEDGQEMWQVRLLGMDGAGSAPLRIGIVGDPGLTQGQFVKPHGLTLHVIDRKGDSVMWWTAERLEAGPVAGTGKTTGKAGE